MTSSEEAASYLVRRIHRMVEDSCPDTCMSSMDAMGNRSIHRTLASQLQVHRAPWWKRWFFGDDDTWYVVRGRRLRVWVQGIGSDYGSGDHYDVLMVGCDIFTHRSRLHYVDPEIPSAEGAEIYDALRRDGWSRYAARDASQAVVKSAPENVS